MSWVSVLFEGFKLLTGGLNATSRLIEATKASEPPPPVPEPPEPLRSGAPDALSYLEGRSDEQHRQWMREQQRARVADDAEAEAERPVDDGGTPP